ncbi:MAG: RNA-binding S4 domain-containing protein [Clostridia bacterium]|nr:RNA-binding S4 domain-containing protein [Clostridia bacterium]
MRIDKFLKVSRILKRRTLANSACDSDKVFVNGKAVKPSHRVKEGDEVTIEFLSGKLTFIIKGLNEKASKEEASTLYEIVKD